MSKINRKKKKKMRLKVNVNDKKTVSAVSSRSQRPVSKVAPVKSEPAKSENTLPDSKKNFLLSENVNNLDSKTIITKEERLFAPTNAKIPQTKQYDMKVPQWIKDFFYYIVIPCLILLVVLKFFSVRAIERELFRSDKATIERELVEVGSEGYGNINLIQVNAGDYVNKGDVLYTYTSSQLDAKINQLRADSLQVIVTNNPDGVVSLDEFNENLQFNVRAKKEGIVKEIYASEGSYTTKENVIMEIEGSDTIVEAEIVIPPNLIKKVEAGNKAIVYVTPTKQVEGVVSRVYPEYDSETNLLKVDIDILDDESVEDIYTGSPVNSIVIIEDDFTQRLLSIINKIPFAPLRELFDHEVK